jgi:hypothetical protein
VVLASHLFVGSYGPGIASHHGRALTHRRPRRSWPAREYGMGIGMPLCGSVRGVVAWLSSVSGRVTGGSRPSRRPRRSAHGNSTGEKKQRRDGQRVREGEGGGTELREGSFSRGFTALSYVHLYNLLWTKSPKALKIRRQQYKNSKISNEDVMEFL